MWKNSDNIDYYEHVPVERLQEFVSIGGFSDNCDLELIYPVIQHLPHIIEVGAGYGRIIDFLLKKKYIGSITAVERSASLYNYLAQQYAEQARLIHANVETLNFKNEFNAVLLMWSGLSEWPKQNQLEIMLKLFSWVMPNGYLIIELFDPSQVPLNSTSCNQQFYQGKSEYGTFVGYTPNQDEMKEYLSSLKASTHFIPYKTTVGRKRRLYMIQK